MNEIDKLIEKQLQTLPQNLQRAINAVPWKALVQEIGKSNSLNTEQIDSLERETMFIIYAFEPAEDYVANLTREIMLPTDVTSNIAKSITEKIFEPILKKSEEIGTPTAQPVVQTPTPKPVAPASVPEIHPTNLPMVEKEEVAHSVPHVEQKSAPQPIKPEKPQMPTPDYRYDKGKDPYREPLV